MSDFIPLTDASPFRRIAAAMWANPRDPSIYGTMDIDAGPALEFLDAHSAHNGHELTVTRLVTRAVALARRDQPELDAKVRFWGKLEQRTSIDPILTLPPPVARTSPACASIAPTSARSSTSPASWANARATCTSTCPALACRATRSAPP